jgi:hypothetical protein
LEEKYSQNISFKAEKGFKSEPSLWVSDPYPINKRYLELNKHFSDLTKQNIVQLKSVSFDKSKEMELFEEITSFGDYSLKDENDESVRRVIIDLGESFLSTSFLANLKNYW